MTVNELLNGKWCAVYYIVIAIILKNIAAVPPNTKDSGKPTKVTRITILANLQRFIDYPNNLRCGLFNGVPNIDGLCSGVTSSTIDAGFWLSVVVTIL